MPISIFIIIDVMLALMILSVPTLAVNAIIKIAAIIALCILLSINNQKLIKKIKGNSVIKGQDENNSSTKIEFNKVLLVIAIVIGLICGFYILILNT